MKVKAVFGLLVLGAVAFLIDLSMQKQTVVDLSQVPEAIIAQENEGVAGQVATENGVIGYVVRLSGSAQRVREVDGIVVQDGTELQLHDVVTTDKKSIAQIRLIDGSEIMLGSNAQFTIDEYVFDASGAAASRAMFTFLTGAFSYHRGEIGAQENAVVELVLHYGFIDASKAKELWGGVFSDGLRVFLGSGEAIVSNAFGEQSLASGEGLKVNDDENPLSVPMVLGAEGVALMKKLVSFPE